MKERTNEIINNILKSNGLEYLRDEITKSVIMSVERIRNGGKIVVCGNGGIAVDRNISLEN